MSRINGKRRNNGPDIGMSVAIGITFVTVMGLLVIMTISSGQEYDAKKAARKVADSTWVLVDKQLSKDCEGALLTFALQSDTTQRWSRIVDRLHEGFSEFASVKLGEVVKFEVSSRALSGNPHDMVSYLKPRRM